jgi:predicted GIY-YIG superfamily endonuclease
MKEYSKEDLIQFTNYIIHQINDTLKSCYEKNIEVKNEYFVDVDDYSDEYNMEQYLKQLNRDKKINDILEMKELNEKSFLGIKYQESELDEKSKKTLIKMKELKKECKKTLIELSYNLLGLLTFSFLLKIIWNNYIHMLFNLTEITLLQAGALLLLVTLFKKIGSKK